MRREPALQKLRANAEGLKTFHVWHLAIFGSVARDEAQRSSDVDILAEFEPDAPIGFLEFVRLRRLLGDILGCQVDLVARDDYHELLNECSTAPVVVDWSKEVDRAVLRPQRFRLCPL